VILCQAGNAQIADTPLKRMLTPTSAHPAKKNVNFSMIVPMKARMTESGKRITELIPQKINREKPLQMLKMTF
jgi:hypothetical protein